MSQPKLHVSTRATHAVKSGRMTYLASCFLVCEYTWLACRTSPTSQYKKEVSRRLWCDKSRIRRRLQFYLGTVWGTRTVEVLSQCDVLLSCCGPEWRTVRASTEKWHQSALLSPTALSSCPTGRRGQTTWTHREKQHSFCQNNLNYL